MIRANGQIHISRPPDQVFDFLADLTNEPKFNPDATDIVKITDGPVGLGTVYTENVKPLGYFEVHVHEFDRPRLLGYDAKNKRADVKVLFHFEPVAEGTAMRADLEMQPKGAFKLMTPLLRPMMKSVMKKQRAPKIKAAVESS